MKLPFILAVLHSLGSDASTRSSLTFDNFTAISTCYLDFVFEESNRPAGSGPDSYLSPTGQVIPDYQQAYFGIFTNPRPPTAFAPSAESPTISKLWDCWDFLYIADFEFILSKIRPTDMFSSFNHHHYQAVTQLVGIIEEHASNIPEEAIHFYDYLHKHKTDEIHSQVLIHAWGASSVYTILDEGGFVTPPLVDLFPSKFFQHLDLEEAYMAKGELSRANCTELNELHGASNGIENRLWYFREDVQFNMHHWKWHIKFTKNSVQPIPRRGELFYFFHREIVTRYAAERLSNGFKDYFVEEIIPVENVVIAQGYDSYMTDGVSGLHYIDRPNNTVLNNQTLPEIYMIFLRVQKLVWDRVKNITKSRGMAHTPNGTYVHLIPDAINPIGELVEAGGHSIDIVFYGGGCFRDEFNNEQCFRTGLHDALHGLIAAAQFLRPKDQIDTQIGVIGDVSTAVRDMVFYRIHTSVNNLFMTYKEAILPPYQLEEGEHPLVMKEILAIDLNVNTVNWQGGWSNPGELFTHWRKKDFILGGGLDLMSNETFANLCVKHLDHQEFEYKILLENISPTNQQAFVRIFLAPRYNGLKTQFKYEEQYRLMFTMDAFTTTLTPGFQILKRSSLDSSVTVDWPKSQEELQKEVDSHTIFANSSTCGWPHHLLLPKGTEEGMVYDLVVMITPAEGIDIFDYKGWTQCGLKNKEYPDKKPMGYPWDRRPNPDMAINYLQDLVYQVPNMMTTQIVITHSDLLANEKNVVPIWFHWHVSNI